MFVVVHVEIQLGSVLVAEAVNLQVDDDMAFQDAVVEDKVGFVVVLVNKDVLLAILEAEAAPHLQEKPLQVVQNGRLQLCLCIGIQLFHAKKLQRDWIVQNLSGRYLLRCLGCQPL